MLIMLKFRDNKIVKFTFLKPTACSASIGLRWLQLIYLFFYSRKIYKYGFRMIHGFRVMRDTEYLLSKSGNTVWI